MSTGKNDIFYHQWRTLREILGGGRGGGGGKFSTCMHAFGVCLRYANLSNIMLRISIVYQIQCDIATNSSFENTNSSFENTNSSFENTNSSFENTVSSFENTISSFENTISSFKNTNSSFKNTNSSVQNTNSSFQNSGGHFAIFHFRGSRLPETPPPLPSVRHCLK